MGNGKLTEISEKDLQRAVLDNAYPSINPRAQPHSYAEGREHFRLGTFRFDFIVGNKRGGFTIVEFKRYAHHGTFGQLLLYPRAVQLALGRRVPLSIVLITPYLDKGVVDLMQKLDLGEDWTFNALLATGTESHPKLLNPSRVPFGAEYFDRADSKQVQRERLERVFSGAREVGPRGPSRPTMGDDPKLS